jgi:hypothetical protein
MQTRTYGDLFKLIQSLAGVGSFAPTEADDVANQGSNKRLTRVQSGLDTLYPQRRGTY